MTTPAILALALALARAILCATIIVAGTAYCAAKLLNLDDRWRARRRKRALFLRRMNDALADTFLMLAILAAGVLLGIGLSLL